MGSQITCFNMQGSERTSKSTDKWSGSSTETCDKPSTVSAKDPRVCSDFSMNNRIRKTNPTSLSINERMIQAVENNDADLLIELIKKRQACEWSDMYQYVKNREQVNPVETACQMGHIRMLEIFLENGCSPNLPTTSGRLIHTLLKSIQANKIDTEDGRIMIERLCKQGCNVNLKDIHYKTPLLYAAEIGNVKVLQILLLVADPGILRCKDLPNGFTPLHMSVMRGDLDCVLEMLKYLSTSDFVNMQDNRGKTALHLSLVAMHKNLEYMNSLANSSCKNALQENQLRVLLCLQENSIAITETLLLRGADPNYCTIGANYNIGDHVILATDTPLFLALSLVNQDETAAVLNGNLSPYSEWTQVLKSFMPNSSLSDDSDDKPSSYSSLVRLLVMFGAECWGTRELWMDTFENSSRIRPLIDEIFVYLEGKNEKPERLLHICKKVIRNILVSSFNLQNIHKLPLPISLKAYIKYQYL